MTTPTLEEEVRKDVLVRRATNALNAASALMLAGTFAMTLDSNPVQCTAFNRGDKPVVVVEQYRFRGDDIVVENTATPERGDYISLSDYLSRIPGEADRRREEAEIKKVVWSGE